MSRIAMAGWFGLATVFVLGTALFNRNQGADATSVVIARTNRTVSTEDVLYQDPRIDPSDDDEQLNEESPPPLQEHSVLPCPVENSCLCSAAATSTAPVMPAPDPSAGTGDVECSTTNEPH